MNIKKLWYRVRALYFRVSGSSAPLAEAAVQGAISEMRSLLNKGMRVNSRNKDGETPLHEAAYQGQIEATRVLIEHGADLNAKDAEGATPLHAAAHCAYDSGDYVETAKALLAAGAEVDARNNGDWTALHEAAFAGNDGRRRTVLMAELLLKHKANVKLVNDWGATPLHLASYQGNADLVKLLLQHGADVAATDGEGKTPLLDCAGHGCGADKGHTKTIRLLLKAGADINEQMPYRPEKSSSSRIGNGRTALHEVCLYAEPEDPELNGIAKILLEAGANPNIQDSSGWTALHVCVAMKRNHIIPDLLRHGADVLVEDQNGNRASAYALHHHDEGLAKQLIELELNAESNKTRSHRSERPFGGASKSVEKPLKTPKKRHLKGQKNEQRGSNSIPSESLGERGALRPVQSSTSDEKSLNVIFVRSAMLPFYPDENARAAADEMLRLASTTCCRICRAHPAGPDAVAVVIPGAEKAEKQQAEVSGICASCAAGNDDKQLAAKIKAAQNAAPRNVG